jgi:hypothetical protein
VGTPYISLERFKVLSVMPTEDIDAIEQKTAGWCEEQSNLISREIDARLCKRYAVPFDAPVSTVVEGWVSKILTPRAYWKRGTNPGDEQTRIINDAAQAAWLEVKEAADAKEGLFDLPRIEGSKESGVVRGGPLVYSETSPFVWRTRQGERGHQEDNSGNGHGP